MTATDTSLHFQVQDLYADHHGWLIHWLRRRLGCTHSAADVAHDIFVRILGSRDVLRLQEPRAFLTVAAKRMLIDRARRQRIEQAYLSELALAADALEGYPPPEQILAAVEALDQVCRALENMAEKPRRAFLLHYLDGQTHAAIAAQLKVSTKMIQKYLVQALIHCHFALGV